jgi:hypothetical protein
MATSDLQQRDDLAAYMFPKEWARVVLMAGATKKRQQLRKRAEQQVIFDQFLAAGRSCASCCHFEFADAVNKMTCAMGSDFYGYQIAKANGLCLDWSARP